MLWEIHSLRREQLEKLYPLLICLKTVTVSKKPRYMFKGNPASALPCKDQPVHSMARTTSAPEVADDHSLPGKKPAAEEGNFAPLLMGGGVL